ncbi:MAG: hypothetical protein WC881_08440, partial [Elusimicrobiota bacterium]
FRPDAPPALPASAVYRPAPSAAQLGRHSPEQAAHGRMAPGAYANELDEESLKPGPGGQLSDMQRQSLRIAAKSDALEAQLRTVSGVNAPEESDAFGLGRRVIDILTEEKGYDAGGADVRAAQDVRARAASIGADADSYGRGAWTRQIVTGADGSSASDPGSAAVLARSGVDGAGSLSGAVRDRSYGQLLSSLRDGVSRIALKVYRQSLQISVVNVPVSRLAGSLAWQAAGAPLSAADGGRTRSAVAASSVHPARADDVAALEAVAWEAAMTLGSPSPLAETEIFSFMQAAGQREASAPYLPAMSVGQAASVPAPAPASAPIKPIQATAILPFLGLALLALRSRLSA